MDPDATSDDMQDQLDRALFSACRSDDLQSARAAVSSGASFDQDTAMTHLIGHRALHVAAGAGSLEVARFLLAKGASCDPRDELGHTPLYMAAVSCRMLIGPAAIAAAYPPCIL